MWDTVKLLPSDHPAAQSAVLRYDRQAQDTPECPSFMHLHVGFDKTGEAPLPRVYAKVFARTADGRVHFHKDGYTDLRGRFDYASLSDDPNSGATRYSVLVLDESRGAVIREINPPSR